MKRIHDALLASIEHLPQNTKKDLVKLNILWHQIVGDLMSRHSKVIGYDGGEILTIEVESHGWVAPIEMSASYIISRIDTITGSAIKPGKIRVKVASKNEKRNAVITSEDTGLNENVLQEIESITDPLIRQACLRAYKAYPYLN
jgi:hypothetical protein